MLILFDGFCNLCNGFVNFVIDRDTQNHFNFAALQSKTGQKVLKENDFETEEFKTVILWKEGEIYKKSDAVLQIVKYLDGYWKFFYIFRLIPRFIRDFIYDIIAKNRYFLFGKRNTCRVPTPELQSKFL